MDFQMWWMLMYFVLAVANGNPTAGQSWLFRPRARNSWPDAAQRDQDETDAPQTVSMNIESHIQLRYAKTHVSMRMINAASRTQESHFNITVPEMAYISGFVMEVNDVSYVATVKGKQIAQQEYDQAVQRGQGAAHVVASSQDIHELTVYVNVEPKSKLNFHLDYSEILTRRRGLYEHNIRINSAPVADVSTVVHITEGLPISTLRVPKMRHVLTDQEDQAQIEFVRDNEAIVRFSPSKRELNRSATGSARFVVQYDVDRSSVDQNGGEIYVNDGYFVHFFGPSSLPALAKHVTFVLDLSESTNEAKIKQTTAAIESTLDQLHPHDYFSVVQFASTVQVWNLTEYYQAPLTSSKTESTAEDVPKAEELFLNQFDELFAYPVGERSITRAKTLARLISRQSGGRNINDAVLTALNISCSVRSMDKNLTSMIILMTDGGASVGVTDVEVIANNVRSANCNDQVSIFSLALGQDADVHLLKRISSLNGAFDAPVKLSQVIGDIPSPVFNDVRLRYEGVDPDSLTETRLGRLSNGDEMVVTGRVFDSLRVVVDGHAVQLKTFQPKTGRQSPPEDPDLRKSWAYLQVQDLLLQSANDSSLLAQALNFSLQYQFVTPLTSLVVVKPDSETPTTEQNASNSSTQF